MSALYRLEQIGMRYDGAEVLRGATLEFPGGQMVAVVGPNGAGKSTLLGIMAGLRPGHIGRCFFAGKDLGSWRRREFARRVSFVPQSLRLEFPFTAEQVVMMGRTPYCDGLFESPEDHEAVERAMAITEALAFRRRDFRSLSAGERQRVILASAIAQQAQALLLDEPTTFLDLRHQLSIFRVLRDLSRQGLLAITVTHDLNLAAAYCDRVVMLQEGRVVADATPAEVFEPEAIRAVFGVESQFRKGADEKPWLVYW